VGVMGSDVVSVSGTAVGRFATAEAGLNKSVSVSGLRLSGAQAGNYSLEALSLRGRIEAANLTLKELTIQGLTVTSRVYDGTREATITGTPTLVGVNSGDVVQVGGESEVNFLSAAIGTGKTVLVGGYMLSGPDASKYRLTQPTLTGTIEAKPVMVGGISAESKGHDGTRAATLTGTPVLLGVLNGDTVTLSGSGVGQFASAEAGPRQSVSVSGYSLGGAQAGNYRLEAPALKASIWTDVSGVRIEEGYGWGANDQGQLGDGKSVDAGSAVLVEAGARPAGGATKPSVAQLVAQAPELVLIARTGAGSVPVVDSAGVNLWQTAGLPAARLGRVFMIDADAVFRSGPRLIEAAEPICELIEQSRK